MGKKYKKIILFIILILGLVFILGYSYKKYSNSFSEGAIVIKLANLSVNYLDGNAIKTPSKNKTINFSVTNDSNSDVFYSIKMVNIKKFAPNVKLTLVDKSNNKIAIKTNQKSDIIIDNGVKITSHDTHSYSIIIDNPQEDFNVFELEISEDKEADITVTKTIINNNIIKSSPTTKVGEVISTTDEGLISDLDDYGVTYYFRGNVSNNYFKFADKMWRIVRINGDGTIRLILDEPVQVLEQFSSESVDFDKSGISKSLEDWYKANLYSAEKFIVENKYCYDYTLSSDNNVFAAYNRLIVANNPSFNCEGKVISKKIGLLSIDEAIFAGLAVNKPNNSNYLYNSRLNDWWTITPATNDNGFNVFIVRIDGAIVPANSRNIKSIRPVINLSSYLHIEGDGTKENPYKIIEK